MKKLVETKEVEGEGLLSLMGEVVTIYCVKFIYTGKLIGVNDSCILLQNASIVYDTGPHSSKSWAEVQSLPNDWYVTTASIESFGIFKK